MLALSTEKRDRVTSLTAPAYAKINLTLDIRGLRDDGYHELESLVIGLDLHDTVSCTLAESPGIGLVCDDPALAHPDNLASLAAGRLARELGVDPALRITLDKAIPVGGGMGGGSSDAATTLALCNRLWSAGLDDRRLAAIGAELGADIPLFFSLPSAVISGRGERVRRVAMQWSGWAMLVFVPEIVPTASVYGAWRKNDSKPLPDRGVEAILDSSRADDLSGLLGNDLAPAVFRVSKRVADTCHELDRRGFGPMTVSGAGSTLFRLFDDKEAACRTAGTIEDLGLDVSCLVAAAPFGSDL